MKKLVGFTVFSLMFAFASCDDSKRTESSVMEVDTVGMEYEVEKTVKEKQIDVDTTTESKTIERDLESQNNNQ